MRPSRVVVALFLLVTACSRPAPEPAESAEAEPGSPVGAAPSAAAETPAGRDLAAVDLCELVPVATVAEIAGGTPNPDNPFRAGTSATGGRECAYYLTVDGERWPVVIWLEAASDYPESIELFGTGDPIAGLGDGAFSRDSAFGPVVTVWKRDDVTLKVRAGDLELAKELAAAAYDRL